MLSPNPSLTRRMATKRAKKTDVVSPSSAELRKAVEAIAIQPKSGKITLLTRKLFNVLLAVAQQADESGDTYRALLSDIVANSAFDSNDTALVKEHLRRMVSVQVEWSTGTSSQKPGRKWGISTLIADAEILEDPTTRRVWVEFSFAPKIKKKLLDPVQYARLSLQFQSQLRSSAGLALYEICVRYLTNPSHLTMRESWEWCRPILSGTPDTAAGDCRGQRGHQHLRRADRASRRPARRRDPVPRDGAQAADAGPRRTSERIRQHARRPDGENRHSAQGSADALRRQRGKPDSRRAADDRTADAQHDAAAGA